MGGVLKFIGGSALLVISAFVFAAIMAGLQNEDNIPSYALVAGVAQTQVKKYLKAPSMAEFDFPAVQRQGSSEDWGVVGYVSAINSLGGYKKVSYAVRLRRLCKSHLDTSCWRVDGLSIGGKTYIKRETEF